MKSFRVKAEDTANIAPLRGLEANGVKLSLGHQIGRGRFSTVFKGRDEWGNSLAVKVYGADIEESVWRNEVTQLKRFRSPHVVHLHHAFVYDELRYIVMEDGGTDVGRAILPDNADRRKFAMMVARGLLQALQTCHGKGYAHGDVNPGNILVASASGRHGVKLADFAFCRPESECQTMPFALWVPPAECTHPDYGRHGRASDVFHAALVLYQVLDGQPVRFETEDVLADTPSRHALEHADPLARVLAPALSRHSEQRPDVMALWRNLVAEMARQRGKPEK